MTWIGLFDEGSGSDTGKTARSKAQVVRTAGKQLICPKYYIPGFAVAYERVAAGVARAAACNVEYDRKRPKLIIFKREKRTFGVAATTAARTVFLSATRCITARRMRKKV